LKQAKEAKKKILLVSMGTQLQSSSGFVDVIVKVFGKHHGHPENQNIVVLL